MWFLIGKQKIIAILFHVAELIKFDVSLLPLSIRVTYGDTLPSE